MNLKDLKVLFAGCARNCSDFLPKVLDNIKYYSLLFKDSYNIVVENGSTDKTKKILNQNKKKKIFFCFKRISVIYLIEAKDWKRLGI